MKDLSWNIGTDVPEKVTVTRFFGQRKYRYNFAAEPVDEGWRWLSLERTAVFWSRGDVISEIVRMRYTPDDVEAITANVLNDPFDDDKLSDFKELQRWRKKAKQWADELISWAEENGVVSGPGEQNTPQEVTELSPDGMTMLMQAVKLLKTQVVDLPDEQAADVPALFPTWESRIGQAVSVDERLFYAGKLWKVLQAHTVQAEWTPDVVPALFTQVVVQSPDEPEIGTLDNPIPYDGNMALEEGKYYSQDGVTYRCIRSSGAPVYHPLSALIGLYVEVV